jgi:hypothetical protein
MPPLPSSRSASLRRLHRDAPSHRGATLRALRDTYGLAGSTLWGVRGQATRLRAGPRGPGLRGPAATGRSRLERTRSAPARRLGSRGRLRDAAATGGCVRRVRPRRSRPQAHTRASCRREAGRRACCSLGASIAAVSDKGTRISAAARADAARATAERRRRVPCTRPCARRHCSCRRRLHDWRDRKCGGFGTAERWRS